MTSKYLRTTSVWYLYLLPVTWYLPLTDTAVSWRSSNQIATVLTWFAWPDRLLAEGALASDPRVLCTAYRLCTAPGPSDWYPLELCSVQPVQHIWWPYWLVNSRRHLWIFSFEEETSFFKNLMGDMPKPWCYVAANYYENLSVHNG